MAKKVIKINEATLKKIVAESVKKVLKESSSDNIIELSNEQIKEVQELLMEEDPECLYGGYASKGKLKIKVIDVSENEKQINGVLLLLVHGDFDEDNFKPHWIKFDLNDGPEFYRTESDETDEDGEPYYDWNEADIYFNSVDKKILNLFVDSSWL